MSDQGQAHVPAEAAAEDPYDPAGSPDSAWRREGRTPTVGEAREYFDAHVNTGGDPGLMEECVQVLDATEYPSTGTRGRVAGTGSSIPRPSEDQMEEKGSD